MEFHVGNVRRMVKLWIATVVAIIVTSLLANRMAPSPDVATSLGEVAATPTSHGSNFADLAHILPKVAMMDGTVIMTSVNEAFAEPNSLLDLFRESFRLGDGIGHLLNHVLVVAVDPKAFQHCKSVHPFCFHLQVTSINLSSATGFMSDAYVELVWTKLELQQRILELGYNFLFTDVDIMWFRDPFWHVDHHADMTTSCDVFFGDAYNLENWPNTGFYHVKSTNRTVEMLRQWRAARGRFERHHEQTIFNFIKKELAAPPLRARVQFVDTARFSGFCQLFRGDMSQSCTMHANCCVGLDNKLYDLRAMLDQWKDYKSLTPEERKMGSFGWRVPAKCGTPDKKADSPVSS